MVTKIAVMSHERYIVPIYAISIILIISIINAGLQYLGKANLTSFFLCIIIGFILVRSWSEYKWPELYRDAEEAYQIASEYGKENDCIQVYNTSWKSVSGFQEYEKYNSITLVSKDNLQDFLNNQALNYEHIVVYIESGSSVEEKEEIINMFLQQCSNLRCYEPMHEYGYQEAYYFY